MATKPIVSQRMIEAGAKCLASYGQFAEEVAARVFAAMLLEEAIESAAWLRGEVDRLDRMKINPNDRA